MFSYELSMISYYVFSDRLIFLTQGFHSEYNCLFNHNISILYKTGYKNPNPNSDYFYYCELHSFYVFDGIANIVVFVILICVSKCLST